MLHTFMLRGPFVVEEKEEGLDQDFHCFVYFLSIFYHIYVACYRYSRAWQKQD